MTGDHDPFTDALVVAECGVPMNIREIPIAYRSAIAVPITVSRIVIAGMRPSIAVLNPDLSVIALPPADCVGMMPSSAPTEMTDG